MGLCGGDNEAKEGGWLTGSMKVKRLERGGWLTGS